MAAQRQAATGIPVKPVAKRRTLPQTEPQRYEIKFQMIAAAWAAMNRHAGRLVNDQHQAVTKNHAV
jgi:hypothetical protein